MVWISGGAGYRTAENDSCSAYFFCGDVVLEIIEFDVVPFFSFIFLPLRIGNHSVGDPCEGLVVLSLNRFVLI